MVARAGGPLEGRPVVEEASGLVQAQEALDAAAVKSLLLSSFFVVFDVRSFSQFLIIVHTLSYAFLGFVQVRARTSRRGAMAGEPHAWRG